MVNQFELVKNVNSVLPKVDWQFRKSGWEALFVVSGLMLLFLCRPTFASDILDDRIQRTLTQHLIADTAIPPEHVHIVVEAGVVVLSGSVESLWHRFQALQIAESLRGVRSVVNNISVKPALREDRTLQQDVSESLKLALGDSADEISVTVKNGNVTLRGVAGSWVISRLATKSAMTIAGVSDLSNQIHVKAALDRPDDSIRNDVRRRLAADVYVDESAIDVTVRDGRVKLAGRVGTGAEKRRAVNNARVTGAIDVDAEKLTVAWRKADRMRRSSPYVQRSDEEIRKAVEDALLMDPRVNALNPNVAVNSGAVTLSGTVDTLYAQQAAADDARNTTGVWKVDNQLKLRYRAFPPDEKVRRMIADVLRRDAELHASDIGAIVRDNHVRLSGSVDTLGQKVRAQNIIQQIDGVLTLENQISVNPKDHTMSKADLEAAIQDEMFWSPYVDSHRIRVTVEENGQVTLTGTVPGRFVAHTAVQNAFEGGARTVRTQLVMEGGRSLNQQFSAETYQFRPHRIFDFRP